MDKRRIVIIAVSALALGGVLAAANVYMLYWRHIPAEYLPFTRPLLYSADVDDERLVTLDGQDIGHGEITRGPGLPPCNVAAPPAGPATPSKKMVLTEIAEAKNPIGFARQCGSNILWVAEQNGKIRPLVDGKLGDPVLDVSLRMFRPAAGVRSWEMGFESLAFSPDGTRLFVSFSDSTGATRVSEYPAPTSAESRINPDDERPIIAVAQPDGRHNGGTIRIGPDGFLYFGLGDGGSHCGIMAAFPKRFYGKVLRIDPRKQPGGASYGIPADNPFVGNEDPMMPRPEVWVSGVRNPWAFNIDSANGDLWVTDVGEFDREEVNYIPTSARGAELGWPEYEAELGPRSICMFEWDVVDVNVPTRTRPRTPRTAPHFAYAHTNNALGEKRCSVTGGDVYHGSLFPHLQDKFMFGDFCSGEILAISPQQEEPFDTGLRVERLTALAQDHEGFLWAAEYNGKIFKISPEQ